MKGSPLRKDGWPAGVVIAAEVTLTSHFRS